MTDFDRIQADFDRGGLRASFAVAQLQTSLISTEFALQRVWEVEAPRAALARKYVGNARHELDVVRVALARLCPAGART